MQAQALETAWLPPAGQAVTRHEISEIDPRPYVAPGSGRTDTAAASDTEQLDTLPSMERRPASVVPIPRRWAPLVSREERRQVVGDFEGIVEDVDWKTGTFNARLIDLTAGDQLAFDVAEFPTQDIRPDDKELVVEGAVFRVRIMYRIEAGGTRQRFTEVIFRRLPSWQPRHFEIAEQRASELAAFFEDGS
jgi:hypothetical protein